MIYTKVESNMKKRLYLDRLNTRMFSRNWVFFLTSILTNYQKNEKLIINKPINHNKTNKEFDNKQFQKDTLDQIIVDLKSQKTKFQKKIITNIYEKNSYKKGDIPIVDSSTPITAYEFINEKK